LFDEKKTIGIMDYKLIFSALLVSGVFFSCAPVKQSLVKQSVANQTNGDQHIKATKPEKIELLPNDQDSTEYELIIIDPGFDSWFATNHKPEWYYTNDYLANWNYQYVLAWNAKVRDPLSIQSSTDQPFILEIDYRPGIDYGIGLNYKLYHYFKYVEATWGKILPYARQI
jgi:hypothetical protein